MRIAHPELNKFYFNEINTKEKAYWLGFLYADGCVMVDKRSNSKRIRISSNIKDETLIDKFCEATKSNREKKEYYKNVVRLTIWNDDLANDLIKWGCIPRKSNIITLPKLNNRSLYLAFLLGFFDGDGTQYTTRITSGSYNFLKQI